MRRIMIDFKKILSIMLAAVMILGINEIYIREAYAANAVNFEFNYRSHLKEGIANNSPQIEPSQLSGEAAFSSWDFNPDKNNEQFVLQYPVADGIVAQLFVTRENETVAVKYDLYTQSSPNSVEAVKSSTAPATFTVHSMKVGSETNYVNPSTISTTDSNAQIINEGGYSYPSFTIEPNSGFSFIYGSNTVQFLWTKDGSAKNAPQKFNVMTSNILYGNVYDFKLFYADNETTPFAPTATYNASVFSGFNTKDIKAVPYSNDNITANQQVTDGIAGNRDTYIEFSIPVPRGYNYETNKFVAIDINGKPNNTTPASNWNLKTVLSMSAGDPNDKIDITIDNIFNPVTSTLSTLSKASLDGSIGRNNDFITFKIKDVESSLLFSSASITPLDEQRKTSDSIFYSNLTNFEYGAIRSLLEFRITSDGDNYNAVIKPYKNITGFYLVEDKNQPISISKSLGDAILLMPLMLVPGAGDTSQVQIFFKHSSPFVGTNTSGTIPSQILVFEDDPASYSVSVPKNITIVKKRFVPNDPDPTKINIEYQGELLTDIRWDISTFDVIKEYLDDPANAGKSYTLTYNLNMGLTPSVGDNETVLTVDITFNKIGNEYRVSYNQTSPNNKFEIVYEPADGFAQTRSLSSGQSSNDILYDAATLKSTLRGYIRVKTIAAAKNIPNVSGPYNPEKVGLFYPNIYFVTVKPTHIRKNNETASKIEVSSGLSTTLTLQDYGKLSLPPAQDLQAIDPITAVISGVAQEVSIEVNWIAPADKINEYLENSPKYNDNVLTYNLYISQTQPKMTAISTMKYEDRIKPENKIVYITCPDTSGDYRLFISGDIALASPILTAPDPNDGNIEKEALWYLREGYVICIQGIPISENPTIVANVLNGIPSEMINYRIDGLDKNQRYYFGVDSVLNSYQQGESNPAKTEISSFSTIVANTTKGDLEIPKPEDKVPSAPTVDKDLVTLSSAEIIWNKINDDTPGVIIEYEIIRTKDYAVDPSLLDSRGEIATILRSITNNPNVSAFKTNSSLKTIARFVGNNYAAYDSVKYNLEPGQMYKLSDYDLLPNNIYFYYVRTVRTVNGKTTYSMFNGVSVTTKPVSNPINLKVERTEPNINKKTQVCISFDAPVKAITQIQSGELSLQYQIKKDLGDWQTPVTMNSSVLSANASPSTVKDFMHFKYTISNLEPGASYTIRVRLIDKNGDTSIYSNAVEIRMEMDQDEYDKNNTTDQWLQFFKDEANKALKQYYWTGNDTSSSKTIIYRPSMFNDLMNSTINGNFELVKSDATKTTYYFPASAMLTLDSSGKSFVFTKNGLNFLMNIKSANINSSQAISLINQKLKNKEISDYYMTVTVNLLPNSQRINGEMPVSGYITISVDMVGSTKVIRTFDDSLVEILAQKISAQVSNKTNTEDIKKMITDGKASEEMIRLINSVITSVLKDFNAEVERELSKILKFSYSSGGAYRITLNPSESYDVIKAYTQSGSVYNPISVLNSGSGYIIEATAGNTYIYTGASINIPDIPNASGAKDIVAKYGLDSLLGSGMAFNADKNMTGYMLYGSIAKMMGASSAQDAIAYIKSLGYDATASKKQSDMSMQEALYLVMSLYEKNTGTKISSIKITNYNLLNNVTGIDDKYRNYLQAAYEMKAWSDSKMNAKSSVSVGEFLEMLTKIKTKAKL